MCIIIADTRALEEKVAELIRELSALPAPSIEDALLKILQKIVELGEEEKRNRQPPVGGEGFSPGCLVWH